MIILKERLPYFKSRFGPKSCDVSQLQAIYRGIEHRTQIKILLTQLGVEHRELSAWGFMSSF